MKKNLRKSLDDKMQVKLPENLKTENIVSKLQDNAEYVPEEKKVVRFSVKKFIPIAASFTVIIGLLGLYFGETKMVKPIEKEVNNTVNQVVTYENYDEIYKKLKEIKREQEKADRYHILNGAGNMADKTAGDTDFDALPENSKEDAVNESSSSEVDRGTGKTNTQEQGVDEADVIKTDGEYVYVINRNENRFTVVDKNMKVISKTDLDKNFYANEMYLNGNFAVIIGSERNENLEETTNSAGIPVSNAKKEDLARAYADCTSSYFRLNTSVRVYDLTDKAAPKKVNEYTQQGDVSFTRMIGKKLYCVSNYYVDLFGGNIDDGCIPEVIINDVNKKIPADEIAIIKDTKTPSYAVVTTLDLEKGGEPTAMAILGNADNLYATTENLFVCENLYENTEFTKIHKFSYTADGVEYKATGKVDGYVNNQFSLSSQGKFLRVATTSSNVETKKSSAGDEELVEATLTTNNTLFILDENMQIVGKLGNLAKNERIKSARFVGNTAYIVTFRQTDPLFVIDTTDPCNPKILGELKINGFSQYLHPIADGYLVGVGEDGTETGVNGDCKISLFNVKDPAKPTEVAKKTVTNGKGNAYCDVAMNHKLFINLTNGEFAVPMYWSNYVNPNQTCEFIRYKASGDTLEEVARYNLGSGQVFGATFIDNNMYVFSCEYGQRGIAYMLTAFDLTTNEKIGEVKI